MATRCITGVIIVVIAAAIVTIVDAGVAVAVAVM